MTDNIIGSSYHNIHHFLNYAKWQEDSINQRRLQIMNQRNRAQN